MSKWELNNTFCLISWERNKVWHWNFVHWWSVKYGKFLSKNHAENVHQELAPDTLLILVSNPKQLLHAINSFLNKIFWKRIIRKLLKNNFTFFSNPVSFNRQSYQKQKWSGTSEQLLFRLKNKFKHITLFVTYYMTKFDDVM